MNDMLPILYLVVLVVMFAMLSEPSEAADFTYSPYTHHLFNNGLNETNHIKTVQFNKGFVLGQYTNSFNRNSLLIGWATPGAISVGVVGVTGYREEDFSSTQRGPIELLPMPLIQVKAMITPRLGVAATAVGNGVLTAGILVRVPEI